MGVRFSGYRKPSRNIEQADKDTGSTEQNCLLFHFQGLVQFPTRMRQKHREKRQKELQTLRERRLTLYQRGKNPDLEAGYYGGQI